MLFSDMQKLITNTWNIMVSIKNYHTFHVILPDRMKIEKVQKFVANLLDKKECVTQIKNLKQALNHWLIFKKVHRVIKFNQKTWLKLCSDTNTELRKIEKKKKKKKKRFLKIFFQVYK